MSTIGVDDLDLSLAIPGIEVCDTCEEDDQMIVCAEDRVWSTHTSPRWAVGPFVVVKSVIVLAQMSQWRSHEVYSSLLPLRKA
jgi:hypothetical protein